MNGNVIHDTKNPQYKKAYKELDLSHYNSRIEKIKRNISNIFSFSFSGK
jgi:hypothetical protein